MAPVRLYFPGAPWLLLHIYKPRLPSLLPLPRGPLLLWIIHCVYLKRGIIVFGLMLLRPATYLWDVTDSLVGLPICPILPGVFFF